MGLSVKTGSFTKNTGTGAQAVTGVGFTPKILILWTAYQTSNATFTPDYSFSWGMTTGASESYSCSIGSDGSVSTSNRSKRAAAKALTVVQYGETTLAEADLTSFDADGFTLDWTTNTGGAQIIHYLALGGTDITGQKVLTLTSPTSTGNKAYTGVGFKPNGLILARPVSATALPVSAATADFALSFIDGAGNANALNAGGDDGVANPNHLTYRTLRTGKTTALTNTGVTEREASTWVSMDTDGFTLNYSAVNGAADIFGCLAWKGPRIKVGNTTFSSASVTGTGFTPTALILASAQSTTDAYRADLRVGVGASTGTAQNQTSAIVDDRSSSTGGNTNASGVDDTGQALAIVDGVSYLGNLLLSSFDSDGFTVDGLTGHYTSYMALAAAPTVTTDAASGVEVTEATLNGTVNPQGNSASYYFEWGTTASYGNTTTSQGPTSGSSNLPITALITGLSANTEYHFRCVITGGGTTVYGSDATFTTDAAGVAGYASFDEEG